MDDEKPCLILAMVADIPEAGIEIFQEYESRVLPLLERHAGRLERRLRTADSLVELHIVSFDSRASYESYMADPERIVHRALMVDVDVHQRILEVHDV